MIIFKKKKGKILFILSLLFLIPLIFLISKTPGFKGDLDQSLRILLRQPVLFKSSPIGENKLINYSKKFYYALENRLFGNANFETIKIDISFSELLKLKKDREKALSLGKLYKPEKVNVVINHKDKKYKATARLKGELSEHWGNIKQWSLKINLKGSKTIFSMNEFSISVFAERDFPYNYIISNTLHDLNLLTPRYKNINVVFNGENWGLMLLEEQFSDSFYAENKIKEAPIFKMTNENDFAIRIVGETKGIKNLDDIAKWQGKFETKIYNKNKILRKSNIPSKNTNETLISIFKNIQEVIALNEKVYLPYLSNHQNIESFAKVVAVTAAFGDHHSFLKENARYYLNPYNLKIEPILTDFVHTEIDGKFINNYGLLYSNLFDNKTFRENYLQTVEYLISNFNKIQTESESACYEFGKNCKHIVKLDILRKNLNTLLKLRYNFFDTKNLNKQIRDSDNFNTNNSLDLNLKKIHFRLFDNGDLIINNLTSEKIYLSKLKLMDKINCDINCNKKIVQIDKALEQSSFENSTRLKINIKNVEIYKVAELSYSDAKQGIFSLTEMIEKQNLNKKAFFNNAKSIINNNLILKEKNYILSEGNHSLNEPLIIPPGYNLIIEKGSNLKMSKDAYIHLQNGFLKLNGTYEDPINITSSNPNIYWKGLYVYSKNTNEKTVLNNVNISNVSYFDDGNLQLTGGLNFINSKLEINNINYNNSVSEDAINIVNSDFNIANAKFENILSDAIDIDFGKGNLKDAYFSNIKGDAIDLSGSLATIKNIYADNVYDKAISAGESTNLNIENLRVTSSGIGIAAKDSSIVKGKKISISNCKKYDLAVFVKKSYFSEAFLELEETSSCNLPLIQKGNFAKINGKEIVGKKINVKKLYN